jgi:O-acetylserine/cysteine efflux transporter
MKGSHLALIFLLVIVWGFNFVVIKVGFEEIPPLFLCFLRYFFTSLPAVFFIKFPKTSLKKVVLYGLTMLALPFGTLFVGMNMGVTSGLASLLFQTQVFFSLLLAIIFLKESVSQCQIMGTFLSFIGIALVGVNIGGHGSFFGFLVVILAAAFWGVGNLASKYVGKVNMLSLVVWGSLMAWPPLLAVSLLFEGSQKILFTLTHLSYISIGAILYITYLSTLLGFCIWSFLLHKHHLTTITPFTLLVPVVGMASSVFVLGEPLEYWKIVAALLVISGLYVNFSGNRCLKN